MKVQALMDRLPAGSVAAERYADPEREVYTLGFLTFDAQELRPDVLYFGDPTQLPETLAPDAFGNFLVYGGEPDEVLGQANNVNMVTLTPDADPYACYNALQAFFLENVEVTDKVRRMLTAHFSNNGLQYLVEEASLALDNPIFVVDTSYHYVAYHLGDLEADDTRFGEVMRQEMRYQSILESGVGYIERERIDEKLARQRGPLVAYNDNLGLEAMTGAVMVHGVCLAHVFMAARNHPFGEVDRECFARLVHFVGQELQKLPVFETSRGQMWSYFLSNLLDDEQPSPAVVERRLEVLDYHPWPRLYVVVLKPKEGLLAPESAANVRNQLMGILAHSLSALYHGELVLVINRHEGERLGDYAESTLRKVAQLNGLEVGVSNAFEKLVDIRTYHQQARSAIEYGGLVSHAIDDHGLYHYRDYAYVQMLAVTARGHDLLTFCHPALRKLLDYDKAHGADLMETLFEYLQCAGNTTRAAAMLNLHKNTLLYRLNRIREIMGTDLSSGEECFQLMFSFRVLLYLGLYVPRIRVKRSDLRKPE